MHKIWRENLELHLDELRRDLFANRKLWPIIAERADLKLRTVRSIAYNTARYQNPRLSTLVSIADALETLKQSPER